MNINSVIDYCVDLSFYDLQNYAGENYNKVYAYISQKHGGEKANTLLIGCIFTCIACDGKLSEKEWDFIAQFIGGYTYDKALSVAGEFYCDEAQSVTKELGTVFPSDVRDAFLCLCIAVLCVDKRLEDAEVDFLKKVLGY